MERAVGRLHEGVASLRRTRPPPGAAEKGRRPFRLRRYGTAPTRTRCSKSRWPPIRPREALGHRHAGSTELHVCDARQTSSTCCDVHHGTSSDQWGARWTSGSRNASSRCSRRPCRCRRSCRSRSARLIHNRTPTANPPCPRERIEPSGWSARRAGDRLARLEPAADPDGLFLMPIGVGAGAWPARAPMTARCINDPGPGAPRGRAHAARTQPHRSMYSPRCRLPSP